MVRRGYTGRVPDGKSPAMAKRRRQPPHPARGLIIWLIILAVAVAAAIWLAGSVEEVPLRTIEVDVARPS
jgi:hypothetical protein